MKGKTISILVIALLITTTFTIAKGTMCEKILLEKTDDYNGLTQEIIGDINFMAGWNEKQQLFASDGDLLDNFGYCVDIDGDYAIVSSFADNAYAGSAYIFNYDGSNWNEQQKITASDAESNDRFGRVSIDEDYALVGAYGDSLNSGSAYVFKRSGTIWTEQQKLIASDSTADDYFGISTDIDEDYAVVGAYYKNNQQGDVYVFKRSGSSWSQQQKLTASDGSFGDHFGICVSIDGDYILIGAEGDDNEKGAAYIFKLSGSSWTQEAKLVALDGSDGDRFGINVCIDEDYALIGSFFDDSEKGSAYVFKRSGTMWNQEAKITASDGMSGDKFGTSVSIDADYCIVSAYYDDNQEGSSYVFKRSGTSWIQEIKLTASSGAIGDWFGIDVSIDAFNIIIGAYGDDDIGNNAGCAYIFEKDNNPPHTLDISGPLSGKVGDFYDYNFTNCVDPDGDDMTYYVEWGDGGSDQGFVASGGAFTLTHSWSAKGDYTIKAKLIDKYGLESAWSTLDINMPRVKVLQNNNLLQRLFERFPDIFPIVKKLFNL